MTPAIKSLEKAKANFKIHEYSHDPAAESYGLEASEKLGVDASRVFKTLVVMLDAKEFAVGVIPVAGMLSMKNIAKAAGAKGVAVKPVVVKSDVVSDALIATAKKHKADLIVMASHGRKGIKRLLLGSETQQVLTHSHIPVLVLR